MAKNNFIRRASSSAVAVLVVLCAVFVVPFNQNAYASTGGSTAAPSYWTPLQFDSIYGVNASNGTRWYVDWALNETQGQYFSYDTISQLSSSQTGNVAFGYDAIVHTSVFENGILRKGFYVTLSHSLQTLGSISLYSDELAVSRFELASKSTFFSTGSNEHLFDATLSFTAIKISVVDNKYVLQSNTFNHVFSDQWNFNVNQSVIEMLNDTLWESESLLVFTDFTFKLSNFRYTGDNYDPYLLLYETQYTRAKPRSGASLVTYSDLPVSINQTVVENEFPTDWTSWLGKAVSGFFNFELLPGFKPGILFLAVFGVLILWFLLHLFM